MLAWLVLLGIVLLVCAIGWSIDAPDGFYALLILAPLGAGAYVNSHYSD